MRERGPKRSRSRLRRAARSDPSVRFRRHVSHLWPSIPFDVLDCIVTQTRPKADFPVERDGTPPASRFDRLFTAHFRFDDVFVRADKEASPLLLCPSNVRTLSKLAHHNLRQDAASLFGTIVLTLVCLFVCQPFAPASFVWEGSWPIF